MKSIKMKQLCRMLSLFFMAIVCSIASQAATITLNIADPDAVKVEVLDISSFRPLDIKIRKGANPITYTDEGSYQMTIRACDGYVLESVKAEGNYSDLPVMMSQTNLTLDKTTDGRSYTVNTSSLEDRRTASVTVKVVDENPDFSLICFRRGNEYSGTPLSAAVEEIKFDPSEEKNFSFYRSDYKPFCRFILNGEVVEKASFGEYKCTLRNGDVIEIQMNFPDTMIPVKITYPEGMKQTVQTVAVDHVAVTDWDRDDFGVKSGSTLQVTFNNMSQDYKIDNVIVNGESQPSFMLTYLVTLDPVTIDIVAHFYGKYSVTLEIDDPSHVNVYNSAGLFGDLIEVKESPATIEVDERQNFLAFSTDHGYKIMSVSDGNGKKLDYSPNQPYVTVTDGMTIKIETAALVYDSSFVLFVPETEKLTNGYWMTRNNRVQNNIKQGYDVIGFNTSEQDPHHITMYGDYESVDAFYNDEQLSTTGGSFSWGGVPENGDIIRVFFDGEPAKHDVTVSVDDALDGKVEVITDKITTRTDYDSMSLHEGSHVGIRPAAGTAVKVTVDGEPLVLSEEGTHDIYVAGPHKIQVVSDTESGAALIEGSYSEKDVYNLQGIRLTKAASANEVKTLPEGIYIYNGKKIIVKY